MKIIAGNHRGRKLKTLATDDTRPTSSKIRGAIFNALGQFFRSGTVLDLFSGSGAMAIEAISRGCEYADCIDKNKAACKVIGENVSMIGLSEQIKVHCTDYLTFLKRTTKTYDYIFLDPPYRMKVLEEIIIQIKERNLLNPDGKIVLEFSNKIYTEAELSFLTVYEVVFNRRYDATQVVILSNNEY